MILTMVILFVRQRLCNSCVATLHVASVGGGKTTKLLVTIVH